VLTDCGTREFPTTMTNEYVKDTSYAQQIETPGHFFPDFPMRSSTNSSSFSFASPCPTYRITPSASRT
jgi:hypothetical protein